MLNLTKCRAYGDRATTSKQIALVAFMGLCRKVFKWPFLLKMADTPAQFFES